MNMNTFCFQHFFLVTSNNLHTSCDPDIIGLFKNFIFHKIYKKNVLLQWQYNFMTISSLHYKNIEMFFSKLWSLDLIPFSLFFSQYFIELYRTISLNWIFKHFLNIYFIANNHHKLSEWQKVQNHVVC